MRRVWWLRQLIALTKLLSVLSVGNSNNWLSHRTASEVTAFGFNSYSRQSTPQPVVLTIVRQEQRQQPSGANKRFPSRRKALDNFFVAILVSSVLDGGPSPARAIWPFPAQNRRQLEVCIVSLLRVLYWAKSLAFEWENLPATTAATATTLSTGNIDDDDDKTNKGEQNRKKQIYLEARLGAKALVTGRVGGGAPYRVYMLGKLELRDCLEDLEYWSGAALPNNLDDSFNRRRAGRVAVSNLKTDLIEAFASLVEFDGLESTLDPSPRSSLMLSMYNENKANFVRRLLLERVIPTTDALINAFGPSARTLSESFLTQYYPNETPPESPSKMVTTLAEDNAL